MMEDIIRDGSAYIRSIMRPLTTLLLFGAIGLSAQAQLWLPVSGGPLSTVNFCQTVSADTCQVAGSDGKLFATRDGGSTFDSVQTIFTTEWFSDMHFPTSQVGYACGGSHYGYYKNIIAKTVDSGTTWWALTHDEYPEEFPMFSFRSIRFLNNDVGFVSGDLGAFMKTEDGGENFTSIDLQLPGINSVNDIYFDGNVGYICTRETENSNDDIYRILKTTDVGQSWTILYADTLVGRTYTTDRGIESVRFQGEIGLACGFNGLLLRTNDGGETWSESILATDVTTLFGLEMVNEQLSFITTCSSYAGELRNTLRSDDGGFTWTPLPEKFLSVSITDGVGYAVDDSYLLLKNAEVVGGIRQNAPGSLKLFPNPSTGSVSVELLKAMPSGQLTVYDGNGRTILEYSIQAQRLLSFSAGDLAAGVYVVEVKENGTDKSFRQRLVLQ